jgi:ABC-type lipoprotein release transport system permease subunit
MRSLRRAAALLAFALGALGRRPGKNLAVALALALVTGAFASVILLTDALRDEARRGMAEMPDITVSRLHGGRPALVTTDLAPRLRVEGVTAVRPRVWGYLFLEGLGSNVSVVGVPAGRVGDLVAPVMHGEVPREGARGWVVLGEGVMRTLGVQPGDVLGLQAPGGAPLDLTLAGSFRRAAALTTADVALMDERDARALLGMAENEATDFAVALGNPDESPVVARKISRELPWARVAERRALARAYELTYGTRGGLVAVMLLPCLLALLVLAWDRATGLSVEERREVGVLKAVGWSTRDVIAARMAEAVLVALAAATLGGLGAYVYVFVLRAPGLLHALLGWSSLYPAFELTPATDGAAVLALLALTVAPYLAAAAVPAWRAATLDPADAMRG